jgi:hypothetical protein
MNCAASDGGTMAERLGLRKRFVGLSEGTPRPLSIGFFVQLDMRSNLSALGEEFATGDEPSKTLIVPARRRPCTAPGPGSGEAD